jgi:hypothetical protein
LHKTYPKHWEIVKAQLDDALRTIYEDLADSKIKIQSFLLRRSSALMAFHSDKDLKEVNAAKGKYKDIPQLIAKLMGESRTAQALFNGVWLHCSRSIFLDEVKKKLAEIEAGDFKDHLVFDTMLKDFSKGLRSDGHSRGKNKWSSAVDLFAEATPICVTYAGDEGEFVYWARLKTIGLNSRVRVPLPWEELLFAPGCFENVPSTMSIPGEVLEQFDLLRDNIFELLNGGPHTLADMIKIMRKSYDDMLELHPSFELDMSFLENKADAVLKRKAQGLN